MEPSDRLQQELVTGLVRNTQNGIDSSNFNHGPHFFAVNDDASVVAFPIRDGGAENVGYNSVGAVWRAAAGKMESVSHNTEIEPRVSFGFPSMSGNGDLLVFFSTFDGADQFGSIAARQVWLRRNRGEGPAGRLIRNLRGFHSPFGQGEDLREENNPAFLLSWGTHGFNARRAVISGDGSTVAFTSYAPDLVANDPLPSNETTQQGVDIFVASIIDTEERQVIAVPAGSAWLWGALALLILMVGVRLLR